MSQEKGMVEAALHLACLVQIADRTPPKFSGNVWKTILRIKEQYQEQYKKRNKQAYTSGARVSGARSDG